VDSADVPGVFGVHRMYQGKWISGLLYLLTGGLFFMGVLYDFWTLNDQVSVRNARIAAPFSNLWLEGLAARKHSRGN
jgi:TM2 domain-containing membrane protein YozV